MQTMILNRLWLYKAPVPKYLDYQHYRILYRFLTRETNCPSQSNGLEFLSFRINLIDPIFVVFKPHRPLPCNNPMGLLSRYIGI